jgi:hypothetical protein
MGEIGGVEFRKNKGAGENSGARKQEGLGINWPVGLPGRVYARAI